MLLHCHAGCPQEAVIAVLKARGLWVERERDKSQIVKTYDYTDEKRKLLFQVVRFEPKNFRQRQPDDVGGWIWNLKGVKRVLYRLPEILEAVKAGKIIYIVEGEKDVEKLVGLGLDATTNAGGAGKWRDEYSQALIGAEVAIIPDNDEPGRKHADQVGRSLHTAGAKVKILELPDLSEKGDVSDWICIHWKTADDLRTLADVAPYFEPEPVEEKPNGKKIGTKTLIHGLIHLVRDNGRIKYLVKEGGALIMKESNINDGKFYQPKQDVPFKILDADILNEDREICYKTLLERIINFIRENLELAHEQEYLVCALWVFHTYLMEKFDTTPLLYFYGVKGTGKSRAGDVLAEIAYKCERLTSPTESVMFRTADLLKSTIIIDEIKLWGPDGNKAIESLLKSRYKRGIKVARINLNKPNPEDQIEYFDVFGPLAICSTESVASAIEDRCLTFIMQQNTTSKVEGKIDEKEAAQIRKKLTIFRFKYIDEKLPEIEPIARRRLNEITKPLLDILMLVDPDRKGEFADYVKYEEIRRSEETIEDTETEIVQVLKETKGIIENRKFATSSIVDELNKGKPEKNRYSLRYISSCLKRLGFEKTRLHGGARGFRYDDHLLKRLTVKYRLDEENKVTEGDGW